MLLVVNLADDAHRDAFEQVGKEWRQVWQPAGLVNAARSTACFTGFGT
jgi:hypothetical protein